MNVLTRILVATDFSAFGHAAVARAARLAKEHRAQLHIVHATPDWKLFSRSISVHQEDYTAVTRHADAALQRDIEWLHAEFGIRARGDVHLGNATETILRIAEQFQPNLLVIGARGEHAPPVAPAALGGTALKLIAHTTVPLLLIRQIEAPIYRETLVAISNARALTNRMLQWCSTVAPQSICHLVRAYDVPYIERLRLCGTGETAINGCVEASRANAQHLTDEVLDVAGERSETHVHLVRGEPLTVVLSEIIRDRVQLLIVGKHSQRSDEAAHSLFGSVGVRLAYHAPIDVMMVP